MHTLLTHIMTIITCIRNLPLNDHSVIYLVDVGMYLLMNSLTKIFESYMALKHQCLNPVKEIE